MKRFLHCVTKVTFSLSLLLCASAHAAPPPNDNFAAAIPLAFNTLTAVNNTDGTFEPGEPPHSAFGRQTTRSAWYHFTPTFSGQIELDSTGSIIDTVVAVYKGTALNKLTLVEKGDDNPGGSSNAIIRLSVTKGIKYYIAFDAYSNGGAMQIIMRPLMQYQAAIFESPLRFTSTIRGGSLEDNGKLTLTMTDKGSVSGKVMLSGKSYSYKSAILINKTIPIVVERAGRLPVFVTVTLETLATGQIRLAAAVSGIMGDKTATATAYQAPKFSKIAPCPRAGNYNYCMSAVDGTGFSVCRLNVSSTGVCKGSGFMGDGTSFTYSVPLLNNDPDDVLLDLDGKGILYHHTPLYGGKGQVAASVSLARIDDNNTQVSGSSGWFRAYSTGLFLPLGIESQVLSVNGKNYVPPAANTRLDPAFNANGGSAGFIAYSSGLTTITKTFTLGTNNVFTFVGDNLNAITLKLDVKTGLLTGSAKFDGQTKASTLRAILIPTGSPGVTPGFYGYNLTPERGGVVSVFSN